MDQKARGIGPGVVDVNRGWLRSRSVRRARPPQAPEAQDDRLTVEPAGCLLELLDSLCRVAFEGESDALNHEPGRSRRLRRSEQICSAFAAGPVVRLG
jgi:hypothetical protein